ncbi:hypothetical protein CY34DRAFT_665742 [Suillus luteus UH-Slu-Lm8-n1]|uniref:Uncharacterized protein n=1 Tax=Suillus luteus UH-Slu-Lm8-n1 TaxID=930992 RepID=A0A0C9Z935_9AGAM|nr:hypothetical protein CY34DRAFT_665742 [Suillus luteus UH-Slu-Lm8-n1]
MHGAPRASSHHKPSPKVASYSNLNPNTGKQAFYAMKPGTHCDTAFHGTCQIVLRSPFTGIVVPFPPRW